MKKPEHKSIELWLCLLYLMVFAMVIVGGVTRLTDSGLSMVEWKPLIGAIPPLSSEDWQVVFHKYQQFPQYQKLNHGISLSQFKSIFYWEYAHRVLGRLIGLVFFFPFLYFWVRGYLDSKLRNRLIIGLLLGGSQGLMGWYMVKSGLVDIPYVSHYRLAAHLGLAFLILGYLLWLIFDLSAISAARKKTVKILPVLFFAVLCVQIIYGAFVAGRDAGIGFNTYPLMGEEFLPAGSFHLEPYWHNFLENNVVIQFVHRWIPLLLFSLLTLIWTKRSKFTQAQSNALIYVTLAFLIQFLLGVLTLLWVVPLRLASLHQAGAIILFSTTLYFCYLNRALKVG
ncbi:MAG: COX15/CtaA family protein [Deltaproteobacteria bacterium]|nr:COX15/CtaA family protein [Deltaproteobacteria bacterium]